ncbi:MAG: hypothetical protein MUO34_00320, partial [Ignavibacteriaceae bacterium]|nr:hypothetical protein [Ignavibacteriaceae bacterium]
TPLEKIKQAYEYNSIEEATQILSKIGNQIKKEGISEDLQPIVIGFAGYGNVSKGAQEILDLLPVKSIKPEELHNLNQVSKDEKTNNVFKVVFEEKDIVNPKKGSFQLQDYYDHPENYEGKFEEYIPYLTILVNCIYWTEKYPRLLTKNFLKSDGYINSEKKLTVVGDVSCDINGSIEITNKATDPGDAFYTYFPNYDSYKDEIHPDGITIMAVDNLPCEFPKDSSKEFSSTLRNYVNEIVNADFNKPYEELSLPYPIKKALILQNGELTKDYLYLNKYLSKV